MTNEEIICLMIGATTNENQAPNTDDVRDDGEYANYKNESRSILNFTINNNYNISIYEKTDPSEDVNISWDTIAVVTKIIIPSLCVLGLMGNILNLTVIMKRVSHSNNIEVQTLESTRISFEHFGSKFIITDNWLTI